ncbi:MAG: hypothetical protein R2704_08340 [Microthrixaceae bacterium]
MGRLGELGGRVLGGARRGLDRILPDGRNTADADSPPVAGDANDPWPDEGDGDAAGDGVSPEPTAAYGVVAPPTERTPVVEQPDDAGSKGSGKGLRWRLMAFAVVTLALLLPGSFAIGVVGDDEGQGPLPEGWAGAQRITVSTAADGRDGSLRDAIGIAGESGTDTVVELKPTVYRLTQGCERSDRASVLEFTDDDNAVGDLDLPSEGGGVRIEGNGATIVQECPGQRVLHSTGAGRVELSQVTLTGGQATDPLGNGSGGALLSEGGADVAVLDSLLTSNTAEGTGGAVTISGPPGRLELSRSVVSGNSAGSAGGGVWVLGTLEATNATITDNQAGSNGGAVATDAFLTFSSVVDNSATTSQGGRQLGAAELTAFASYVAGGAGASASCSVERAVSSGYNVGDDPSCGFGSGIGDLADGPRDGVGLLGLYARSIPARPPVRSSVLVDRVPPPACREHALVDGQGRERAGDLGCDVGAVELPVGLEVPLTATASRVAEPVSARATYTG